MQEDEPTVATAQRSRFCCCLPVVVVFLSALLACGGSPPRLARGADTEIVLAAVRTNAWAHSARLEVPPFVLYSDGTVIYTRGKQFFTAKLAPQEVDGLWHRLRRAGFFEVPKKITLAPHMTDLDVGRVAVRTEGGWRIVRIYAPDVTPRGCSKIDAVRREFLALNAFRTVGEESWHPAELAVHLTGYSYAPGGDIPWPDGLTRPPEEQLPPDRSDDPGVPTTYLHRIPAKEHGVLASLLEEQHHRDRAAVVVHGKKWAVHVAPVVPGVLALFRALEKHSDWPWEFDYTAAEPTEPCKVNAPDFSWQ